MNNICIYFCMSINIHIHIDRIIPNKIMISNKSENCNVM